jgi:hypothetical protein
MEPYLLSLFTFFLGLFFGHRLTLWRDQRKEFNDITQPIRAALLKERTNPIPYTAGPSEIDADLLESALPIWKRRGFRKALDAYHQAKKKNIVQEKTYGTCSFANTEEIIQHINYVLHYTTRK